ncbi:zinc finger BED domain-containing protein RICESLEEPER 2-like [Rhizophagus clarus]|uniref:Zinc finger BED domain-containing protein RICESLEEPER 2-like n=1 Tax=Rhizophagus clarus TaxID=94130 RepID=A0A8H3R046_9GLOM|nr:zinc finger BED domain-containing protein RICESLEEPER 2-like [Rhizophagus clarus]
MENWELKSFLLDFIKLEGPHSGANIKEAFLKSLKNFNIESNILRVTTDNASNNITFLKAVETDLSQRYIHFNTIQNDDESSDEEVDSLIHKLRILIKKIKASSQQEEKFRAQCKVANVPNLNVVLNVRTRWNSIYDMLVRARKLKEPLNTLSNSDLSLRPYVINEEEWVHLLEMEELLKEAAINAINKLKNYYNKTDSTLYAVSLILHPCLKVEYMKDNERERQWIDKTKKSVKNFFELYLPL